MPTPKIVPRVLALTVLTFAAAALTGCQSSTPGTPPSAPAAPAAPADTVPKVASVVKGSFGTLADGTAIDLYTLTNHQGMEIKVITYGGIIQSLKVGDKAARLGDVVLGFNTIGDYEKDSPYFGAIVGRYGNRIGGARFTLDGKTYTLSKNDGANTLHGGTKGFDKQVWTAKPIEVEGSVGVELSLTSKDGDEGYPGTLLETVTYRLTPANELIVDYRAHTDKATPVNVTQHSYFNLAGEGNGTINDHVMQIHADRLTPVVKGLIPTGALTSVAGTPFDFRTPTAIGARIESKDPQMVLGSGYDHNWVLTRAGAADGALAPVLKVVEPTSGRTLEMESTEPGLQFYTGNFLDGHLIAKSGKRYVHRAAFCVETQHFPDSPNQPKFPSTIVRPDKDYTSRTVFRFGVQR